VHVAERGVDAALGGDCVTSRGEELGNASRVEAGLGQTESGTQTGAAGTDNEGIVLMVLFTPRVNSSGSSKIARIPAGVTYDDRVLAADQRRCLLRPERPVGEDAGCKQRNVSAAMLPNSRAGHWVTYQPAVLWKRRGSGHARAVRVGPRVSQTGTFRIARKTEREQSAKPTGAEESRKTHRRRRGQPSPSH